jgi:hypothetical protein
MIQKVKIKEIKPNPNNPRICKDDKFKKLVKSIQDFPEMLEIRPIVVNDEMIVLGGNMRLKACIEAGLKEIPIIKASNLTIEQQNEFIIKDNVGFGEWDWEVLANEWDNEQLNEWGLEVWENNESEIDYSDKNNEIDTDFENAKYVFKLEYSETEYLELKEKIQNIGKTPESIFYEALR